MPFGGLQQLGIEAVIAPGFGEIFFGNALNNRLLLIVLPQDQIALLPAGIAAGNRQLTIDIEKMTVDNGTKSVHFSLAERHKKMIVEGLDMVGATMQMLPAIAAFEKKHDAAFPWAKVRPVASVH